MNVRLDMDTGAVLTRLKKALNPAQFALDAQVLKDSNFYCPEDTGDLQRAGITGSKIGSGELIWNTDYARTQYYTESPKSIDKNPNARGKWFEAAKATCKKTWEVIANASFGK